MEVTTLMGFPVSRSVWLGPGGPWEVGQPEEGRSTRSLAEEQRHGDSFLLSSPFGDRSCFLSIPLWTVGWAGGWQTLYFSKDSERSPASSAKG